MTSEEQVTFSQKSSELWKTLNFLSFLLLQWSVGYSSCFPVIFRNGTSNVYPLTVIWFMA